MLQHFLYELAGAAMLIIAAGILWIAKPVDGVPAAFLRKAGWHEIVYSLIVVFTLTSGLGSLLLGFTT